MCTHSELRVGGRARVDGHGFGVSERTTNGHREIDSGGPLPERRTVGWAAAEGVR